MREVIRPATPLVVGLTGLENMDKFLGGETKMMVGTIGLVEEVGFNTGGVGFTTTGAGAGFTTGVGFTTGAGEGFTTGVGFGTTGAGAGVGTGVGGGIGVSTNW